MLGGNVFQNLGAMTKEKYKIGVEKNLNGRMKESVLR